MLALIRELWLPDHAGCDHSPRQHHLPSEAMRLLDRRLARAPKRLSRGRDLPAVIDLLLKDDSVLEVPIDDLPPHTPESPVSKRVFELSLRHFILREWLRQKGIEVRAAVMAGEAWMVDHSADGNSDSQRVRCPSLASTRREVIQVAIVTSSMCLGGMSEIRRKSGRIGEGRGTFTRPEISMPVGPSLLLNGLLASSTA